VLLITLLGGVGDLAGGFRFTTKEEAGTAGAGYILLIQAEINEEDKLPTCGRVRFRPRDLSGSETSAWVEGPGKGKGACPSTEFGPEDGSG
jgi:hypothetical protein